MKKTAIEILKNHGWYDPNVDAGNYRIPMPYVLDFMEEYASQSKPDGEKTVEQYYIEQINPDAEKFKTDPIHKRIIQLIKGYADLKSGNKLDVVEVENVLLKALGNFEAYSGVPRYRQYAEAICNHFSSQSTPAKVEEKKVNRRRDLEEKYIEVYCRDYSDKEKAQVRNALQVGWEIRNKQKLPLQKANQDNCIGRIEAIISGSLDGLELDNTCDVIEKSLVIDMLNDIKKELPTTNP